MIRPQCQLVGYALWLFSTLAGAAQASDDVLGSFDIVRFAVSGDTLLGDATIDALLAGYRGKARHFSDVQAALDALESAYRAHGFNLVHVQLPEQVLDQGIIQLAVVPVHIARVQVLGNRFFDNANIRASVPGLREGESPNLTGVSASLRAANDNPAKKTSLTLASADSDDAVNATLQVSDQKPWSASLSLDNAGNEKTGLTQLSTQLQYYNVAGLDQVLSLQYTTTVEQPQRVSVYGAGYHIPLYAWGDSIDLYGSSSDVDSGTVSTGTFNLQVSGRGQVWGGRYNHNLARSGTLEGKLMAGLEQKVYQNSLGYQGLQLGNNITVQPFSLGYSGELQGAASSTGFYVTALGNLPGGSSPADFARSRSAASSSYSVLRYGASHQQALPLDWQLRLLFNGQMSSDALVPGEQFGVGGAASVRGLTERAVADDQGQLLNIELYTPSLCPAHLDAAAQCRLLAFYDAGHVSRNHALAGERNDATVASVGLGLRLMDGKHLTLQLDVGQVVTASDSQAAGDSRVHLKMNLSY